MKPAKTTTRTSIDLDATDELPVLDVAAYEAEVVSGGPTGLSDSRTTATEPDPHAAGTPAPGHRVPDAAPVVADSDVVLAVEHWIEQKTEELLAHHDALNLSQHERTTAVARAEALNRELTDARAAETQRNAALAASEALLAQRSGELQALQRTHDALTADQQRTAHELAALETRLRDSEARERSAQRTIEAQIHTHAGLTLRVQHETSERERLAAEGKALQAQLATCLENLQSREAYRTIYESTLQESDSELAAARRRTAEQETRANQLDAELQSRDRRLQDAIRERDEARHLRDAEIAANGSATDRMRELESAIVSHQAELTNARLEIERGRALLSDLTAALLKSQTLFSDQGRLLEEREAAASAMAANHAEQAALIATLRGQIEELAARLATPEAQRRALEERVAVLMKEVEASDSRLTRLESMNSELRATVGQLNTALAERAAELQRARQIASMNAFALGRVQSRIDELGHSPTAFEGAPGPTQVSVLTRIDNGQNHSVVLRTRTTVGRDSDNDLPLAMRSVSRHHAVLIPGFRTVFVQDLRSTNGVLVNQRRVRCARLEHGDMITFGKAQFRYTVTPAPASVR